MSGYELNLPTDPPVPPAKPSLLNEGDVPCPACGRPLAPGTVVCMACGYDMLSGAKAKTAVGEEEVAPPPRPIVGEKGLSQRAATVIGASLLFPALCIAWWFTKPETPFGIRLERILLVAIEALTSVGTGLVAVWFAAWLSGRPFGRVDLAAARLFACISAFLLVFSLHIPIPFLGLGAVMKVAAAVGVYWLAVRMLIGRETRTTNLVVLAHAVATVLLFIQTALWSGTYQYVEW